MIVAVDTNCILPGRVGGIENYTLGLVEALRLPGSPADRLVLLTRPENQDLFAPFADHHTAVVPLARPAAGWAELTAGDAAAGRRALADYQRYKSQVIHAHTVDVVHFPGNTINPIDLDLPTVLNLHDLQHRHYPQYFTPAEIDDRERWWVGSARRAGALLAASEYVRTDVHAQLGVPRDDIFVAPDAFQSSFFAEPTAAERDGLRQRMAVPERFFLYPAAAWPHKNHRRLIRAFAAAALPGVHLILTGGGQAESGLAEFAAELGVASTVRLAGRVSTADLHGLYRLATALVFPSEYESWSIPIMEAFASGCPVASSDVTSLPDEVGDAGLLFDPRDEAAMATAMRRLATDDALRRRLADRGRARVQGFGPQPFLRTLTAAYDHAARAHRRRRAA